MIDPKYWTDSCQPTSRYTVESDLQVQFRVHKDLLYVHFIHSDAQSYWLRKDG